MKTDVKLKGFGDIAKNLWDYYRYYPKYLYLKTTGNNWVNDGHKTIPYSRFVYHEVLVDGVVAHFDSAAKDKPARAPAPKDKPTKPFIDVNIHVHKETKKDDK